MRQQLNGGTLRGRMVDTRYAPSFRRLTCIVVGGTLPVLAVMIAFRAVDLPSLFLGVVVLAASVFDAGRAHTVWLGPDFIAAHGQRVRFIDIREGEAIRGFIGDSYVSDSARIGVSALFLSRFQRSE